MTMTRTCLVVVACFVMLWCSPPVVAEDQSGLEVDKDKRVIRIPAKIAPRKLPHLQEIYPLEVIACWPHPKGKKAHETVVTIDVQPSAVHEALVQLGLKPGAPVMGESDQPPQGPEVNLYLEILGPGGINRQVSIDRTMVDRRTGKPFPKSVQWRFTGSVLTKPDPNSDKTVYGADESGTLIAIFPVTNQTVMQTSLTVKEEKYLKLEVNQQLLPKEGTDVKLVIEVPAR